MRTVVLCSARGAPGVTTTSLLLAARFDGAVLVEADLAGGVLAVRYGLGREPGLVTLAASNPTQAGGWLDHAQDAGGVAVLVGPDGHRIVHGGTSLRQATLVTAEVEAAIAALVPLAPLHQHRALSALAAARRALPDTPHVACFDTSFHSTLPRVTRTYALPRSWRERWDLERFGFHGLSHAWAAAHGATVGGLPGRARIVTCHLGGGASLCAVVDGRSVDTTMGFTPLDGIVMATRAGGVDPGLLLWLLTHGGLDASEVAEGLDHHAGLAGLANSGDMRDVLTGRADGDPDAVLGFDVYVHRLCQGIAAMAVSMGGLDLVVFTGGVGEHAAPVRAVAAKGLTFLGVKVDRHANETASGDADITAVGAAVRTVVVTSREDLEISRQVRGLLSRPGDRP